MVRNGNKYNVNLMSILKIFTDSIYSYKLQRLIYAKFVYLITLLYFLILVPHNLFHL